ncbi:MAG: thioredoxin domain-containing protein [Gemmatimonadota bacterium]|nr:thioredoxin domain-containing protein [Gemmatimonadota bacterium]
MPNRLTHETSPYLLQHQDNPVDWYPWGPEALERARREDRPILLSVGYSACHWCHVMEHESFEDPETAGIMNEHFVNIKVDREERPDIDSIYMNAVQQMTGHGGWPMTVFLTPDGAPFYGGTYYPPQPRYGMPSFRQVLLGVSEAYRERRSDVDRSAEELRGALRQSMAMRGPAASLDPSILDRAYQALAARFDARHGGFGGAPKFPQPMTLEFVLRHWSRTGAPEALRMVEHTLRKMAGGGMYDQLGGGFHRYSVDAQWLVPHFEKMLYDNALLARLYLHAWQATGDAEYRRVVEEVLLYVRREMLSPEGGFYSAQDADSEGEEGKFYVWTPGEVDAVLGPEEGPLFRRFYDVTEKGNFEGKNILHVERGAREVADEAGVTVAELERVLARGRELLYEARSRRVWPGRDDKVLTSWNAMMLQSFAEAARVLGRSEYEEVAVRSAEFLLRELRPGGRLLRTWKAGEAKIDAFLEDHGLLVDALLALYEATGEARWVREARALADVMLERFWEEEEGVFYDTAAEGEALVVRPRDPFDNATPSGTSAATLALLRLGSLVGEERYARVAVRVLEGVGELLTRIPAAFGHLLSALDFHLAVPREVVVVGRRGEEDTEALLEVLRHGFRPNTLLALHDPEAGSEAEALIPLLEGRTRLDGRATAYVCERYTCQLPAGDPQSLRAQLTPATGATVPGAP